MVARAACYSSGSTRRSCFVCARCCLPSRRRARLPAVGRVSTRLGSTWSASSISRSSRSSAAWRLAACDRRSPARTTIASSTIRARSRPRTCCSSAAVRLSSASGSRNSMRVCERLRCWPPGPDPVVARNSARSTGMYLPSARCIRPLEHTWRRVARLCEVPRRAISGVRAVRPVERGPHCSSHDLWRLSANVSLAGYVVGISFSPS